MNTQSADQLAYNIKSEILRLQTERNSLITLLESCVSRGSPFAVRDSFQASISSLDRQLGVINRLCLGVDLYS